MKNLIIVILFAIATCSANWGPESREVLERIAASLEKIEKHLAKNCATSKATQVSQVDNAWPNYTYDAKNVNHPLKAKPTHDENDDPLLHCVDKCGNLYDKDEDRLTKCIDYCIERY